jgi:ornithine carbamoyltransferase
VIEVKTEIASVEELLRRHDAKVRLAPRIAEARFGARPMVTARLLVVADSSTNRRRLERMAAVSPFPVLNMLSASDHPLQALADLLTIWRLCGRIEGTRIAFVGEANNVARSLAEGCSLLGADFVIASPEGYGFADPMPNVRQLVDPTDAVEGAAFVCTDVWVSMGQDSEARARHAALAPYRVDEALMARAPDAWFLHCLPARPGEDVTAGVIDGPRSALWRQAENRMHSARGAISWLMAE